MWCLKDLCRIPKLKFLLNDVFFIFCEESVGWLRFVCTAALVVAFVDVAVGVAAAVAVVVAFVAAAVGVAVVVVAAALLA